MEIYKQTDLEKKIFYYSKENLVNRSGARAIISIFLLIILSVLVILIIDDTFLKNKYFSGVSKNADFYMQGIFGSASLFFCISGILSVILVLSGIKPASKIFFISGLVLLTAFLSVFFQNIKTPGYNGGMIGIKLDSLFLQSSFFIKTCVYFFWIGTTVFLLLYPVRNAVSEILLKIISLLSARNGKRDNRKKNIKGNKNKPANEKKGGMKVVFNAKKRVVDGRKTANIPWLSKVVYENTSDRIEIPIVPDNGEKIKKFKLDRKSDYTQSFVEVDTFSINKDEIHTKVNNDEYFDKVKENWPEKWKNNSISGKEMQVYEDVAMIENPEEFDDAELMNDEDTVLENINPENIIDAEIVDDKTAGLLMEENNNINIEEIFDKNFKKQKRILMPENSFDPDSFRLPNSRILKRSDVKGNIRQFKAHEKESAMILESTLMEFDLKAEVCEIIHGPVVTLYKLIPAPGIKLSKIEGLSNNLALRLAAQSIRIIAPIPGEKVVGIEIPNKKRELVSFKEIVNSEVFTDSKHNIPIGLGKDIYGNIIVVDLYKMPHILIAGATGAGKSVCVNSFISSILFSRTPDEVRLVFIDPKIVELKPYNNIPHLLTPVVTESRQALNTLKFLLYEMERRYSLLDEMGVRDIVDYRKMHEKKKYLEQLPFIVCFVDEFADLMTTSGKEAEMLFARLAAKARAVGILLVLATQRPSADVITGLIKANIPARIAFQVISLQDSRIILDQKGAEKLLGQGDMLYLSPSQPFPIRIQGAFLSKEEVDSIAEHWKSISTPQYIDINEFLNIDEDESDFQVDGESKDPLFEQAIEIVYQTKKASASYLQRRLNIGYNRAARMVEEMEAMGIVGPQRGAKAREVIGILGDK